jgi:O-antigen/teichoic acid export membrane protein
MLGKAELAAAIGYAGAILFFTSSFGIGMAIAAGALVSRALGIGDRGRAQRQATNSLIYGAVFGALFAGLVWVFLRPLSALLGASGQTLDLTVSYLSIVVPSLPLLLVGMVGGAILRAHGDAARSMYATIGGAVVSAVLDRLAPRHGIELVNVTDEDEYFPPPRNIRELQSAIGTAAVTLLGGDPASTASFDDHRLAASDVLAALRTS